MRWTGVWPALTTPFADGEPWPDALRANLRRYATLDLGGYLVLGSTGEAVLLEERERERLLGAARESIPEGKPLLVGVPGESTRLAQWQARQAADGGADAVLVSVPHYFRAEMSDEALIAHLSAVADSCSVPVFLYNVPKFTGLSLSMTVVETLCRHPNVVGIKESSGDLDYLKRIVSAVGSEMTVLCGAFSIWSEALEAGAAGGILAIATVLPEPLIGVATGVRAPEAARRAIDQAATLIAGRHGVAGIKAAMDQRGLQGGDVRRPLQPVGVRAREEIGRAIRQLVEQGILPEARL